jgi:hypothetical protein
MQFHLSCTNPVKAQFGHRCVTDANRNKAPLVSDFVKETYCSYYELEPCLLSQILSHFDLGAFLWIIRNFFINCRWWSLAWAKLYEMLLELQEPHYSGNSMWNTMNNFSMEESGYSKSLLLFRKYKIRWHNNRFQMYTCIDIHIPHEKIFSKCFLNFNWNRVLDFLLFTDHVRICILNTSLITSARPQDGSVFSWASGNVCVCVCVCVCVYVYVLERGRDNGRGLLM